jgi:hypothetical protein
MTPLATNKAQHTKPYISNPVEAVPVAAKYTITSKAIMLYTNAQNNITGINFMPGVAFGVVCST